MIPSTMGGWVITLALVPFCCLFVWFIRLGVRAHESGERREAERLGALMATAVGMFAKADPAPFDARYERHERVYASGMRETTYTRVDHDKRASNIAKALNDAALRLIAYHLLMSRSRSWNV